jgi:hypothetical protein
MAQQQREENSVLFSLKELRRMEDDRIRKEDDDRRSLEEAERRAREDAERRAVEEVERARREAEERVRKTEEERLGRDREEQMRLAEAERRARVEGEMRLQHERMRLEVQHRKVSSPLKAILIAVSVVVVIAGGLVYKLWSDHRTELATQRAESIRLAQESAKRESEYQKRYEAMVAQKERAMATAKSEEERNRIRVEMEQEREKERARRARAPRQVQPAVPKPSAPPTMRRPRDVPDDPLGGLKL